MFRCQTLGVRVWSGCSQSARISANLVVPARFPLPRVFDTLVSHREHVALVVEHGGTEGIVTMEDVIETLLGLEIMDEGDEIQDMRQLARRRWEEQEARLDRPEVVVPPSGSKEHERD